MDEDLQTLESELKQLRPARPGPGLMRRVEAQLAGNAEGNRRRPFWWAVALPAAAALAILLVQPWRKSEPIAPSRVGSPGGVEAGEPGLKPVAMEKILYAAEDEGIVTLSDGTPARRERLQYVDTITWRDPRSNASLKWTLPREEVRVVPVSFQ